MLNCLHRIIFTICVCLVSNYSWSQTNLDSLREEVAIAKEDTTKVKLLGVLSQELSHSNREEANELIHEARGLANKLNFREGIAMLDYTQAMSFLDAGTLDSSQFYFLQALEYYEKAKNQERVFNSLNKLGQVHALRNSFDLAKDYYDRAFEIAKSSQNDKLLGNAYNAFGAFYINQAWHYGDNYNDSIKAESLFRESIPYLDSATEFFNRAGYSRGAALSFANMAIIQKELGDLENSKLSMKQSERYFDSLGLKMYLVSAYNHLTNIYLQQKKYDSALIKVEQTLDLAKELDSKFDIRNAYGQYSYIYRALGQFDKYLEVHSLYDDFNMQLLDDEKQTAIDELEILYKSENQEREISIQKAENERQKLILIIVVVIVISLVIIVSFLYRKNKREQYFKSLLIQQTEELKSINEEMSAQKDQLEETNQKLLESSAEQSNIMAVVAHDLRSPLNKVKGLAGLLEMTKLSNEQKEINSKSLQVAEEGLELISDIMRLKEYESDFDLKKEHVDISALLQSTVSNHQAYALRKKIKLTLTSDCDKKVFATDMLLFSRIMDNLISNAIKFSDSGKEVVINCRLSDQLAVEVIDQGPGFTEEDLKSVFKRFKKLSAQPTGGENSSGLGLSIVKTLVDKLNGTIDIETEVKKGTIFRLTFP